VLHATTVAGCYRELAHAVETHAAADDVWSRKVATAMQHWADLFAGTTIPALPPQPHVLRLPEAVS
jgi:hypothetical protein